PNPPLIASVRSERQSSSRRKGHIMSSSNRTRSAEIRARVGHPIIASAGHVVEFEPALLDYIRDVGGSNMLERYKTAWDTAFYFRWNHVTPEERREFRVPRPV